MIELGVHVHVLVVDVYKSRGGHDLTEHLLDRSKCGIRSCLGVFVLLA